MPGKLASLAEKITDRESTTNIFDNQEPEAVLIVTVLDIIQRFCSRNARA